MLSECAKACGCRNVPPPLPAASSGSAECADRDKSGACSTWAAAGECESNPAFMKLRCAASCGTCDWLDYKKRCPMPTNRTPAVPQGRMSETFERALREFEALEPTVHSRDPWVMSFDRFLSPDEVEAVLAHGEGRYTRSTASGGRKDDEFVSDAACRVIGRALLTKCDSFDGRSCVRLVSGQVPLTSDIRTSWTTWCDNATCTDDPTIQRIYERVSDVAQVGRWAAHHRRHKPPATKERAPALSRRELGGVHDCAGCRGEL